MVRGSRASGDFKMKNNLATPRAKEYLLDLAERTGVTIENFDELTQEEVSRKIDELKGSKKVTRRVTMEETTENLDGVRLGLCIKLVYQKWISYHKDVAVEKDEFKREVLNLYKISSEIEGVN